MDIGITLMDTEGLALIPDGGKKSVGLQCKKGSSMTGNLGPWLRCKGCQTQLKAVKPPTAVPKTLKIDHKTRYAREVDTLIVKLLPGI